MIQEPMQSEAKPFYPRSPYVVAKLYDHWITVRAFVVEEDARCAVSSSLTRKVTNGVARIKLNQARELTDTAAVDAALARERPDAVVHLAGQALI